MTARKIRGAWWADFRVAGQRIRKKSPENSRAGATEFEEVLRERLAEGLDVDGPAATPAEADRSCFAGFSAHWYDTHVIPNNKYSEQVAKKYALARHLIPAFGALKLHEITSYHVARYAARKAAEGLAAKTVNNQLTMLRRCLRSAEEWGLLKQLPRIARLPTRPADMDFLSPVEAETLLSDEAEPRWNGMVRLALRAGLRLGEIMALRAADVDPERGILRVSRSYSRGRLGTPKGNRSRSIPVTSDLAAMLRQAKLPPSSELFGLSDYASAAKALTRICARTGVRRVGFHALRHTNASSLVAAGVPLLAVKDLLGHVDIQTTMRYAHLAPNALRGAVDALESLNRASATSNVGTKVGTADRPASPFVDIPKQLAA